MSNSIQVYEGDGVKLEKPKRSTHILLHLRAEQIRLTKRGLAGCLLNPGQKYRGMIWILLDKGEDKLIKNSNPGTLLLIRPSEKTPLYIESFGNYSFHEYQEGRTKIKWLVVDKCLMKTNNLRKNLYEAHQDGMLISEPDEVLSTFT